MNTHFILDFESLGNNIKTTPLVNCAFTTFDWDRFVSDPYTFEELVDNMQFVKFDVKDQVNRFACKVEEGALEFWEKQPKDVRKQLTPALDDVNIEAFFEYLTGYLEDTKINYWWSRSNIFDPVMLYRFAEDLDDPRIKKLLKFWNVRDVRTFIDAKFDFTVKYNRFCPVDDEKEWKSKFQEHNSIHDVAADILRLQRITRIEQE